MYASTAVMLLRDSRGCWHAKCRTDDVTTAKHQCQRSSFLLCSTITLYNVIIVWLLENCFLVTAESNELLILANDQ
jgi:hypothetical protein